MQQVFEVICTKGHYSIELLGPQDTSRQHGIHFDAKTGKGWLAYETPWGTTEVMHTDCGARLIVPAEA